MSFSLKLNLTTVELAVVGSVVDLLITLIATARVSSSLDCVLALRFEEDEEDDDLESDFDDADDHDKHMQSVIPLGHFLVMVVGNPKQQPEDVDDRR